MSKISRNCVIKKSFSRNFSYLLNRRQYSLPNTKFYYSFKLKSRLCTATTVKSHSLASLLKPMHVKVVEEEKSMLLNLYSILELMEAPAEELEIVRDTIQRIDEVFMVVVVGEFNAGKSTFINGLLGAKFVRDGVLPTTAKITILRNTKDLNNDENIWIKEKKVLIDDMEEVNLPVDWLQHVALIDTPGTNAIVAKHELLTQRIVPRADLVLFVTSAERPLSESESSFLSKISQWGKKIIMIVNKIDILQSEEKKQVLDFVSQNAAKIIGGVSNIIPVYGVSSRLALNAKLAVPGGDPAMGAAAASWERSQFDALEKLLKDLLGKEELIIGKLSNVIGVTDRIVIDNLKKIEFRKISLESDIKVLEMINDNLSLALKDLDRDLQHYRLQIDDHLQNIIEKCDNYLNKNVTIFRPDLFLNMSKFQSEFLEQVLSGFTKPIDETLSEMSVLVGLRAKVQAKAILDYIGDRPKKYSTDMVGVIRDEQFDGLRHDLLDKLRVETEDVLRVIDESKIAQSVRQEVERSLYQATGVQAVSAAAMGGLLSMQLLDVTGITALSSAMVMGLLIVPWRKSSIKKSFRDRITVLKTHLNKSVSKSLSSQLEILQSRIMESIGPYSRFVRIEKQKIEQLEDSLLKSKETARGIKSEINKFIL